MLMPKKVKHRKHHKGRKRGRGVAQRKNSVCFGEFGLKAVSRSWITSRQIESTRRVLVKAIKKGGRVWIRIFPDKPVTAKGPEVPMGKGKGAVDHYVAVVQPGMVLFEIGGVSREIALEAVKLASHKLPIKAKFVEKNS